MQEDKKIIMSVNPELPYAIEEAINRLRINVNFLGKDVRKIMIVSSEPNEGKSFITFSLWKQMAAAGVKTVLIDGDMRNSTLVEKYGVKRSDGQEVKGLSHYLSGDEELMKSCSIQNLKTAIFCPMRKISSIPPCFLATRSLRSC